MARLTYLPLILHHSETPPRTDLQRQSLPIHLPPQRSKHRAAQTNQNTHDTSLTALNARKRNRIERDSARWVDTCGKDKDALMLKLSTPPNSHHQLASTLPRQQARQSPAFLQA